MLAIVPVGVVDIVEKVIRRAIRRTQVEQTGQAWGVLCEIEADVKTSSENDLDIIRSGSKQACIDYPTWQLRRVLGRQVRRQF